MSVTLCDSCVLDGHTFTVCTCMMRMLLRLCCRGREVVSTAAVLIAASHWIVG